MKYRLTALLWAAVLALNLLFPAAAQPADLSALADSMEETLMTEDGAGDVQSWLDTALTQGAGATSEWTVLTLAQRGTNPDFTAYASALYACAAENPAVGAVIRQRYALVLTACGVRDGLESEILSQTLGQQGIMSLVFGLHLMNNGVSAPDCSAEDTVSAILEAQLADGGWALSGDAGDVDVTAMTLSALAPHTGDPRTASAVDRGVELLSGRQLETGGFSGFGAENPESAAQVIVALSGLGIDCRTDPRFLKNGLSPLEGMLRFRLEDGRFSHDESGEPNRTSLTQAYEAVTALWRLEQGLGSLLLADPHTTSLPEMTPDASPSTPDAEQIPAEAAGGYKLWVCLGVLGVAALLCLLLFLRGRRKWKSYAGVGLAAAAICAVTLLTTFQCAGGYYGSSAQKDAVGTVTLTIRCDTVAGETEDIPADGVILPETTFSLAEGETVYDILVQAAREYRIQTENKGVTAGSEELAYIRGIAYLYEYDFGELSGWVYRVNGVQPSVGCGAYTLSDGDRVEWLYTRELGNDLGTAVDP